MATEKTGVNVTFGNMTMQVSNKDAAKKEFNIFANVRINDGKIEALESGNFSKAEGTGNGWFSFDSANINYGCNGLSVEEAESAVKAVIDFYKEVKDIIDAKNTEE